MFLCWFDNLLNKILGFCWNWTWVCAWGFGWVGECGEPWILDWIWFFVWFLNWIWDWLWVWIRVWFWVWIWCFGWTWLLNWISDCIWVTLLDALGDWGFVICFTCGFINGLALRGSEGLGEIGGGFEPFKPADGLAGTFDVFSGGELNFILFASFPEFSLILVIFEMGCEGDDCECIKFDERSDFCALGPLGELWGELVLAEVSSVVWGRLSSELGFLGDLGLLSVKNGWLTAVGDVSWIFDVSTLWSSWFSWLGVVVWLLSTANLVVQWGGRLGLQYKIKNLIFSFLQWIYWFLSTWVWTYVLAMCTRVHSHSPTESLCGAVG